MKDRDGCTPLYCAAAWNQVEAVRQLDRLGCPSWQKSLEGRTPVHVAAEQGWVELISLLIQELRNKVRTALNYKVNEPHSLMPLRYGGAAFEITPALQFLWTVERSAWRSNASSWHLKSCESLSEAFWVAVCHGMTHGQSVGREYYNLICS